MKRQTVPKQKKKTKRYIFCPVFRFENKPSPGAKKKKFGNKTKSFFWFFTSLSLI